MMVSLCKQYYQFFLAQAVLLGFSLAFLTIPSMAVTARHFDKSRGLATGLTIAGSSFGGIIWPILLDELLNHYKISFGWSLRIVGFMMVPLASIATILVQEPAGHVKTVESATTEGQGVQKKKRKTDLSILRNVTFMICVGAVAIYGTFFSKLVSS